MEGREDQELKVSLNYTRSLRPSLGYMRPPSQREQKGEKL